MTPKVERALKRWLREMFRPALLAGLPPGRVFQLDWSLQTGRLLRVGLFVRPIEADARDAGPRARLYCSISTVGRRGFEAVNPLAFAFVPAEIVPLCEWRLVGPENPFLSSFCADAARARACLERAEQAGPRLAGVERRAP